MCISNEDLYYIKCIVSYIIHLQRQILAPAVSKQISSAFSCCDVFAESKQGTTH